MKPETIKAVNTIIDNGEVVDAIELLLKLYDKSKYGDSIIALNLRSKRFRAKYDKSSF